MSLEGRYIPEPNSGCWLWTGCVNEWGYGHMTTSTKVTSLAHRHAWRLYKGAIPAGAYVLHKCDVPCCVNPDHLFIGNDKINSDDKIAKGRARYAVGERARHAKLVSSDIPVIRADPRPNTVICRDYGVSNSAISLIKRRKVWRHIP